jgi:alpha-glucosidase
MQRFSAGWMGDNHSWWEHLELAMPQLLNMGLSGVRFVGTTSAGLAGTRPRAVCALDAGGRALAVFARAFGGGDRAARAWRFGADVEAICRDYLRLRYRLLPYFYTLFWKRTTTARP